MWEPYIQSVKKWCPATDIVFDLFHVVKAFGKVMDQVRNQEYRKADKAGKQVLKGSKYVLDVWPRAGRSVGNVDPIGLSDFEVLGQGQQRDS